MKVLFLLINSVCDISCTYCFYTPGHEKRSGFRVHPKRASHIAEKIASAGFNTVILSGGDPLHSRLKHETYILVRELKMRGLRVIINTSAACLDMDIEIIKEMTGFSRSQIFALRSKYLDKGITSIEDPARHNPKELLSKKDRDEIIETVKTKKPEDIGYHSEFWTTACKKTQIRSF